MNRHSKSRSGCRVCKRKRLKCDETTPACLNCVRRGIDCPGYQQTLRWSTKHESAGRAFKSSSSELPEFSELASAASQSIRQSPASARATRRPSGVRADARASSVPKSPSSPSTVFLRPPDAGTPLYTIAPSPSETCPETPGTLSDAGRTVDSDGTQDLVVLDGEERCSGTAPLVELLGSDFMSETMELAMAAVSGLNDQEESIEPGGSDQALMVAGQPDYAIGPVQSLSEPSTALVEFWFKSVCGTWAAYDSRSNPFRRLCSSLWASSGSVFYSLQSMAAASLPVHSMSPSIKEIAILAPQMSTRALIRELDDLFKSPNTVLTIPTGLVVALFCMSSSLSWIDSRQLGIQYLRNTRTVLNLLEMRSEFLCKEDRDLLEFFRGCLIYEEMLRSIVSSDDEDIRALLDWHSPSSESGGGGLTLHAWTGVPTSIIWLFGKVMALCRRSRNLWRRSAHATYTLMQQAMADIQEGKELEEELLAIDIPSMEELTSPHDDDVTEDQDPNLREYLFMATEAFRLSSLLQLYQTFPDLVSQRLPHQVASDRLVPHDRWLNPLALYIVEILKKIPPTSGMRCLQPLLCICAGSALRYDTASTPALGDRKDFELPAASSGMDIFTSLSDSSLDPVDIREARRFLRRRLDHLEQSLPRKPIAVARQLLEEIWMTVDKEAPPKRSHWLDIMTTGKFESVFG